MEYTDAEKSLIESTQWPSNLDGVTADALIVHGARLAVSWSYQSHELMRIAFATDKEAPEYKPAMRAYMDALVGMIAEAQVVDLLVQVQKENPSQAEELAQRIWQITEDGGVLTEFMWEYLVARGVDADAVFAVAEREASTVHPDRSTT